MDGMKGEKDPAVSGRFPSEDAETLRRENERLLAAINEFSTRFAAVNFKAYEMAEEIRNLEMGLSGSQASRRRLEWENSQLRMEVRFLRKVLLELCDPPQAVRELVTAYRRELEARGEILENNDPS